MKKVILTIAILFLFASAFAQKRKPDTAKTNKADTAKIDTSGFIISKDEATLLFNYSNFVILAMPVTTAKEVTPAAATATRDFFIALQKKIYKKYFEKPKSKRTDK